MSKKAIKMSEFFNRKLVDDGVEIPLPIPGSEGVATITIRSVDSQAFHRAKFARQRKALELSKIKDEEAKFKATYDADTELLSSLVAGWSFWEECSPENIRKLLTESPHVRSIVDDTATDSSRFFGKR